MLLCADWCRVLILSHLVKISGTCVYWQSDVAGHRESAVVIVYVAATYITYDK